MNPYLIFLLISMVSNSRDFQQAPGKDHIEAFFQQLTANGGQWEATLPPSDEHDFSSFLMHFSADGKYSVRGTIKGIKISGDTIHIWDIWEFPDPSRQNTTVLIQRSDWAYGIGSSNFTSPEKRNGELEFTYYNAAQQKHRDTHQFTGLDNMISTSADFNTESGTWGAPIEMNWLRKF